MNRYRRFLTLGFIVLLPAAGLVPGADAGTVVVPGTANIFGAGHSTPPSPNGGGGGTLPILISLPSDVEYVQFDDITGAVIWDPTWPSNGAEGTTSGYGSTDISSYGGISGIAHSQRIMFTTGVFLSNAAPADPAPARLSFTDSSTSFTSLSPSLGQTFYIGDGLTGHGSGTIQQFYAPQGATRLYLGFADSLNFHYSPGQYGNNSGQLTADYTIVSDNLPTYWKGTPGSPGLWGTAGNWTSQVPTAIKDAFIQNGGTARVVSGTANAKSVTVGQGGQGTLEVLSGAQLTLSTGTLTIGSFGTLSGNGQINGSVENSGTLSPTGGVALEVAGNYTQRIGGKLQVNLNGHVSGDSDFLSVAGTASVDGSIVVAMDRSYALNAGEYYDICRANQKLVLQGLPTVTGAAPASLSWFPHKARTPQGQDCLRLSVVGPRVQGDVDCPYPDVHKTGFDDGSMCWAAVTADLLWQQGWAREVRYPNDSRMFRNEREVFEYIKGFWPNQAGYADEGAEWFLDGTTGPATGGSWFTGGKNGNGGKDFTYGCNRNCPGVTSWPNIQAHLAAGEAVEVLVTQDANSSKEGHDVACWWAPAYAVISDSDDSYGACKYMVKQRPSGSATSWVLVNNSAMGYYYICGYSWLKPSSLFLNCKDYNFGTMGGWAASGPGKAEVIADPNDSANYVMALTTGSPVSISRTVDAFSEAFVVNFDYQFTTTSGTLAVFLGSTLLGTLTAPADGQLSMLNEDMWVTDPGLLGQTGLLLTFSLDGPTGSQILLDNISMYVPVEVPEPATLTLLAVGALCLLGWAWRRRRAT